MRELTPSYTLILPKKCGFRKTGSANQNIFQFLIKRKTTRRNSKNMQKNCLVCTASFAGGRSRGAGFNRFAQKRFVLRSATAAKQDFEADAPESCLAGEVGFEPTHVGSKGRCLTAWLLPNLVQSKLEGLIFQAKFATITRQQTKTIARIKMREESPGTFS